MLLEFHAIQNKNYYHFHLINELREKGMHETKKKYALFI